MFTYIHYQVVTNGNSELRASVPVLKKIYQHCTDKTVFSLVFLAPEECVSVHIRTCISQRMITSLARSLSRAPPSLMKTGNWYSDPRGHETTIDLRIDTTLGLHLDGIFRYEKGPCPDQELANTLPSNFLVST